ncbi:MAG: 2-oxoacid:acceptor oxidoreductase family protein [Bacillota bacterium]|nr:2-oxoacid:acceptor oxidoreductase family protein [Bacillota bacterium]
MNNQFELRLSGAGGQGLLLAGIVLAEAGILDDKYAVQTQSYGPEARGGASKSEVIISNAFIDYPEVRTPNLVLALSQEAANKYLRTDMSNGIIVVDERVKISEDVKYDRLIRVPIMKTAKNKVGKAIVANIVSLGIIVEATNVVSKESIEKAIMNRVPRGTEKLNRLALESGYELAK